ncbi:MAG: outer membrane lipoprotein carrier protein LolA [Bacteroidales bacterium]|nr:outer membrane lipoprotein carrier protein LolA [Bacteroidales bacterium]
MNKIDESNDRSTIPPFRGDARRAGGYQNIFLKQSRRDKTHEALITPHKRSAVWGLVLLLLVTSASAQTLKKAAPDQAKKMVETVGKATAAVKSIQCDFTQIRQSTMLKEKQTSKGQMFFAGKNLKWAYTSPNKYALIVKADGQVYIQQDGKTRKADGQSGQLFKGIAQVVMNSVTGAALSENGDFTVEMYTQGDQWVAKLTPKQAKLKKMFTNIYLYFNDKHNAVTKVEMKEANGDTTTITFANTKLNEKIADSVFN